MYIKHKEYPPITHISTHPLSITFKGWLGFSIKSDGSSGKPNSSRRGSRASYSTRLYKPFCWGGVGCFKPRLARLVRRKAWVGVGKEQEQKKKKVARLSFMDGRIAGGVAKNSKG